MKAGILTQHRVLNFGSVLQAYALQKRLFDLKIDNEIIDYIYPNKAHLIPDPPRTLRSLISEKIRNLIPRRFLKRDNSEVSNIKKFVNTKLILSKNSFQSPSDLAENCPKYDVYITGSDQVWNTEYLRGDNSFFFPFVDENAKKISYAASFGRFTFSGEQAVMWLSNLNFYDAISVREKKAIEIINQYTSLNPKQVLDPTLLLTRNEWLSFANLSDVNRKSYILVYVLTYAWNPLPYAEEVIKHFQSITGLEVMLLEPESLITTNHNWKHIVNASPEEFVRLFAEASLVITTSFHGTAFAINLETPFYVVTKNNRVNDDRIQSLLRMLQIEDRSVELGSPFPAMLKQDNSEALKNLKILRQQSMNFLKENLCNLH